MFRAAASSGCRFGARHLPPRRRRSFCASVVAVEDRTLFSTLSAISWKTGGVTHSDVFGIGFSNTVYVNKDSAGWVSLGGHAQQVSAGLDAAGNPEVFAIGGGHAVYVNKGGKRWVDLGGYATAISATVDNTVFAIGEGHAVYVDRGSGFASLGGYAKAISAGLDAAGKPEVYRIGRKSAVYGDDGGEGWVRLGGGATSISATADHTVFIIGRGDFVYVDHGSGFVSLGGYAMAISAGLDAAGEPEVYAIGRDNTAASSDDGRGWVNLGGYVTELSTTISGGLFARGEDVSSIYVDRGGPSLDVLGTIPLENPTSATRYLPPQAGTPLFLPGNNNEPSFLDVDQGDLGDCWLLASLAEVAARDPKMITNMFTDEGTTVVNGCTVGLYLVRFYNGDGSPFEIEVNSELPAAGQYDDFIESGLGTQVLWVALAEKAYAEANTLGFVTTSHEGVGSYNALNGGFPSWALEAITGRPARDNDISAKKLAAAWNAGDEIVLDTGMPRNSHLVADHAYAVVGYNANSSKLLELYNPWGTDASGRVPGYSRIYGLFETHMTLLKRNFSGQSVGNPDAHVQLTSAYRTSNQAEIHEQR